MSSISQKTIIIIGAAGGMGSAITAMLAKERAKLALADFNEAGLTTVAQQAHESGAAQVFTGIVDITAESQVQSFFANIKATFGGADALINLPGMSIAAKVEEMALEDYNRILDLNLMSAFMSAKYFIPLVDPKHGGQIINTSSMAARRANPNAPVYCAAKAAVSVFGQGLALQLKEKKIRVSTLNPGPTNTTGFWGDRPVPREKFMLPEDIAEVVKFILNLPERIVVHDIGFESFEFFK